MKFEQKTMRRLLIYVIKDIDGIADEYIFPVLEEMDKYTEEIIIVSGFPLQKESREKLKFYAEKIIELEDCKDTALIQKAAIERLGWEKPESFDEVLFMDDTVMGPLYPLRDMFVSMSEKNVDFWGITEAYQDESEPNGMCDYGYFPNYIQMYFFAVRKNMLESKEFHDYWKNVTLQSRHERRFTRYFSDCGYRFGVFIEAEEYLDLSYVPLLEVAVRMLKEKKSPFFQIESFTRDYTKVLAKSAGEEGCLLLEYLQKETAFDTNLLMAHILRSENPEDIKKNLNHNYVISDKRSYISETARQRKVALVMHLYFPELVEESYAYAQSMPEYADVYITTDSQEKREVIEKVFSKLPCHHLDIRVVPNCGRDVGPFLVESAEYLQNYDLVCHTHDKKASQVRPGSIGLSFSYRCFENILKSKIFVENIIETFEENERLGVLMPPPPNHGPYYFTLGMGWSENYEATKKLMQRLGLRTKISKQKDPVAPLGSAFWVRPKAVAKLFDYGWKYEDFPPEPLPGDGTVLHAIERIYGILVQDAGYYPGWVLNEVCAENEINNLSHMLEFLNREIFIKGRIMGSSKEVVQYLDERFSGLERTGRNVTRSVVTLWLEKQAGIFEENHAKHAALRWEDGMYELVFDKLEEHGELCELCLEPSTAKGIEVGQFKLKVIEENGNSVTYTPECANVSGSGILINHRMVFLASKPKITIQLEKPAILKEIQIQMDICYDISDETAESLKKGYKEPERR